MLADSSVWIDFFNGVQNAAADTLASAIQRKDKVFVGDLILVEVLQGFRSDRDFRQAQMLLAPFPKLQISDERIAIRAAELHRRLRGRGFTVRKTINTLIATRCIVDGIPLLFSDRDYLPFVEHCGLMDASEIEL